MNVHEPTELISRVVPAVVVGAAGLYYLAFPRAFAAVRPYFWNLKLDEANRTRLDAVLDARKDAENLPKWLGFLMGAVSLALAALELVPSVTPVLPYALWCLAFAVMQLGAYFYFKRASEKRIAVLRVRRAFESLPLTVIVAQGIAIAALVGIAVAAAEPSALLVAAAAALTIWISWRIANVPALILGNDVPVETFVDDRLRLMRAVNTASLGIAPVVVYLGMRHVFTGGTVSLALSIVILLAWLPSIAVMMRTNVGSGAAAQLNAALERA